MKIGSQNIQKLYSGSQEIVKAYLGRDVIYENTPPTPPGPANGVYILYTDGSYSAYNTLDSGKTPVGPLLITDNVSLVIHPSEGTSTTWLSSFSLISGVTTTEDVNVAAVDYAGAANTAAVVASGLAGSAFTWATEVIYSDGRVGYLPAGGELEEIRLNIVNINIALGLIGGDEIDMIYPTNLQYWSSTQKNANSVWYARNGAGLYSDTVKTNKKCCRSVSSYSAG